jgi:acyl-coenzyme A synthetase/AMP-(fatty) acid ligase
LDLATLAGSLGSREGAIHTIEKGVGVRRSYKQLRRDCEAAVETLRAWGVAQGVRVGIYAPNSYYWLVMIWRCWKSGDLHRLHRDFKDSLGEEVPKRYEVPVLLTQGLAAVFQTFRACSHYR